MTLARSEIKCARGKNGSFMLAIMRGLNLTLARSELKGAREKNAMLSKLRLLHKYVHLTENITH